MSSESMHASLDPSELGTKTYWDNLYARELTNNIDDADDQGTIWFDESNAERTVLQLLDNLCSRGLIHRSDSASNKASRFLDLGTGNGHMLFQLRDPDAIGNNDEPWTGEMVGVDYSEGSVELAKRIAEQASENEGLQALENLSFECWDLLTAAPGSWLRDGFNVVLDKGTFDAISLMDHAAGGTHPCNRYREKVMPLIRHGGLLVITSCNWTKDELVRWLSSAEDAELELFDEAKYRTFTFGGSTGQSIVTLVFRRNGR